MKLCERREKGGWSDTEESLAGLRTGGQQDWGRRKHRENGSMNEIHVYFHRPYAEPDKQKISNVIS